MGVDGHGYAGLCARAGANIGRRPTATATANNTFYSTYQPILSVRARTMTMSHTLQRMHGHNVRTNFNVNVVQIVSYIIRLARLHCGVH